MHIYYKSQQAVDYKHLLALTPDDEFPHLTRSTVPLLDYWRSAERAANGVLVGLFGRSEIPLGDIHFEYEVPSFKNNMPSCTDVMYLSPTTAIAIEGKWTEPLYGIAADWLREGKVPQNRSDVLAHWTDLIQRQTRNVATQDMPTLEYQMIHRTASVCSTGRQNLALVFQMFGTTAVPESYLTALRRLADTIGAKGNIKIFVHCIPLSPSKEHAALEREITAMKGNPRAHAIRQALAATQLFEFGEGLFFAIAT